MTRQLFRAFGEAISGIRRNALVSFACVSTVALCLFVVCVFVLLAMNLEFIARQIESQVEIKVFLADGLPRDYIRDLERAILSLPGVREVRFVSKEDALEILRAQFGNEAGILEAIEEMNPLPDAFDVRIDPQAVQEVGARISQLPGVEKVQDKRELVERLVSLTRAVRSAGLSLAALLAAVALFIIANTIRIAVYTRRAEIAIMKLVGATDGFIRGPFVIEGMILGAVGSGIAVATVWYGYRWLQLNIARALPFLPVLPHDPHVWQVGRMSIAGGVVLGAAGSAIAIRRYLRA